MDSLTVDRRTRDASAGTAVPERNVRALRSWRAQGARRRGVFATRLALSLLVRQVRSKVIDRLIGDDER